MKAIIAKYYQPVILFVLTFTVASIFSLLSIDPHHHGLLLKPAIDVAHGQMLFRDTFTLYGALTTLLQAWAVRIFGDYLMVIQIETAFFYAMIAVCLYYIWLNILPRWLTTISVIIWLFLAPYLRYLAAAFLPWSSVYALFFQLFSLLLVLHALRKQSRVMTMLAGGVAVLTFWCKQPVGICHCASLIFFLATTPLITGQPWKKAMTDCAFFITGIVAASAPFFVWLALNGAIHDMYLQSIKAAFFLGEQISDIPYAPFASSSHNLFVRILMALFAFNQTASHNSVLWSFLPVVCLTLLAMLAVKRWRNRDSVSNQLPLYGLLLVSLASWMQYYPFPCVRHCYWAATPMIGLLSYGTWQLCSSLKKKNTQIIIVCVILASAFGYDIGVRIYNGYLKITYYNEKIEEPKVLYGMYVPAYDAETFKIINRTLHNAFKKNSPHYLVNLTWDPLYLTFVGPQRNFHPLHGSPDVWNRNIYPEYRKLRSEFIDTKHPLVLWYKGVNIPGWTCIEVYNILDFGYYMNYGRPNRFALYRFTDNNKIP
jgi:hypothetical protein